MDLALVTPVHGRVDLTRIVFEQRRILLEELRGRGLDVCQVVVGDDDNLEAAFDAGFDVVESPNPLGNRINDGFEFAFGELDAKNVTFCGSDSWLLPGPLVDLPEPGTVRSSTTLALCSGRALVYVPARPVRGRAPWTISRALMEPHGFRPVDGTLERLLDAALWRACEAVEPGSFRCRTDDDPLRVVDFRDGPWEEQITPWARIVPRRRSVMKFAPWATLRKRYPDHLVGMMESYFGGG